MRLPAFGPVYEHLQRLHAAAPTRVGVYGLISSGHESLSPIYVHSKVMLVDDEVTCIGSANMDNVSLFRSSEILLVCRQQEYVLLPVVDRIVCRWELKRVRVCAACFPFWRRVEWRCIYAPSSVANIWAPCIAPRWIPILVKHSTRLQRYVRQWFIRSFSGFPTKPC